MRRGENGYRRAYQTRDYRENSFSGYRDHSGYWVNSSRELRRRLGHTVFVENVSKRIHVSALKEAFQCYGQVVDVYIAYRNKKHLRDLTTFSFVRFKSIEDADCAARSGDKRKMDGFRIKVKLTKENGKKAIAKELIQQEKLKAKWNPALKDKRLLEVPIGLAEEVVSSPIEGLRLKSLPNYQEERRDRQAGKSNSGKLGVRTKMAKKQREINHSTKRSKSSGNPKVIRARKLHVQPELLMDKERALKKNTVD
ncbi:hypothetical protein V6N11_071248 [Hibiscus sabdariffa]|uniref:RRM domain-containing protein n=1 Tax=Hibiscus sabdariffa TaxID=183260 RepID=A0ABR2U031_9ROSI